MNLYTKTPVQRFISNHHHHHHHRTPPSPMTTSALFHRPFFNPNPNHHHHHLAPPFRHPPIPQFHSKSTSKDHNNLTASDQPPQSTNRSFAVATGELFLGIASRIIKTSNAMEQRLDSEEKVTMFGEELNGKKESEFWKRWRRKKVDEEEVVAAVVDDGDVVWEQRLKDVEAERGRKAVTSPGFSFSAAGLLFPYHLGVAKFLIEKGYIKDTTPLAGSSAGAIVCAVVASGASMEEALEATKVLAQDCRSRGTAFRLGAVLRDVLEQFLPDDAHIRSNGRVRVAVTQILWRPRGLLVDQFDSREDLINAVITSSFIPGYLAPRPAILFRNRLCVDGGLTLFMPPTSAARTVRVCAFPAERLGLEDIGISPDCNPENRASPRELFNWALEPAADSVLDNLYELGYMDAAVWAASNPVEDLVQEDNPTVSS
ncbi:putative triacylglycerol lipase [Helianthus annuus]|nr:putative triacylglycerol lipase [Helianthus annuus]